MTTLQPSEHEIYQRLPEKLNDKQRAWLRSYLAREKMEDDYEELAQAERDEVDSDFDAEASEDYW